MNTMARIGKIHKPASILFMPDINLFVLTCYDGFQIELTKKQSLSWAEKMGWHYYPACNETADWGHYRYKTQKS